MNTSVQAEILKLREESYTYQAIGNKLGLSRQRIHQIITGYRSPKRKKARKLTYKQRYYLKYKIQVLTYYGGGKLACVHCGFSDIRALSIDHIAGEGHRDRRGNLYCRLIRQNFPPGYQTLCMNCQLIKRFENNENRKKS